MRKKIAFVPLLIILFHNAVQSQTTQWAVKFSDAIIARYPSTINAMTNKGWEYSNGIILHGMEKVYEKTKDTKYLNYIKTYIDTYIGTDGNGVSSKLMQSMDVIQPGILCLFLYKETGLQKYKTASDLIRNYMKTYPRNASQGFWHKSNYPDQMWLDGLYMAEPFLAKYGFRMNDAVSCNNETTLQSLLINLHAYDAGKMLLYHGWDESKKATWANATTGVSPEIWSRAMGWYAMALVDILKYLPDDHPKYDSTLHVLGRVAEGLKKSQDGSSGLWYQVMDKGSLSNNWLETSGSGMFVYALKTAIDYGWIDSSYMSVVRKGWTGLQTKISTYTDGKPQINDFAGAMGIQNTYTQYVTSSLMVDCPTASGIQHPHGYCAILLASSAMEYATPKKYRLQIYSDTHGSVSVMTTEFYQDSGSIVTVIAKPAAGYQFSYWSGDTTGTNDTILVKMNSHKHITANFTELLPKYTLNIVISGSGMVSPSSGGDYDKGTTVTLTASPNTGNKFDSWNGDASGNGITTNVLMDAPKSVTATFIPENVDTSKITKVEQVIEHPSFVCYPSLTKDIFKAIITVPHSTVMNIELIDMNGTIIYSSQRIRANKGVNEYIFDLGSKNSGLYLCRIQYENIIVTQKVAKM